MLAGQKAFVNGKHFGDCYVLYGISTLKVDRHFLQVVKFWR